MSSPPESRSPLVDEVPLTNVPVETGSGTVTPGHQLSIQRIWRRSRLAFGLAPEQLELLASNATTLRFAAGETICRQGEPGRHLYIVARGRLKLSIDRGRGQYQLLDFLSTGDHFGEITLLTDGRYLATAVAATDVELLAIDHEHFQTLMLTVPLFAANVSRSLGFQLRYEASGRRRRWHPRIVALVNSTLRTQQLAGALCEVLSESGRKLCVLSDRDVRWPAMHDVRYEQFPPYPDRTARERWLEERLAHLLERNHQVLVDVTQRGLEDELPALLSACDQIWWLVEPRFADASRENLRRLFAVDPALAPRTHFVWIQEELDRFAPCAGDLEIGRPDFKVVWGEGPATPGSQHDQSLRRLAHHLQGFRVGIALGGGGARGLAHLGVLDELSRAGVVFDLVAGTSIGSLMGAAYAAGWSLDDALDRFSEDLTPPRWLGALPRGNQWFLWLMFRLRAWERLLRRYAGDTRIEQLRVPLATMTVDLVEGREVVRDQGDVVQAILESINLPIIARPILRDGMALVDGGVLNNLPADVLARQGADLVVGVDVGARLSRGFPGAKTASAARRLQRPRLWDTVLRVNEVQEYHVTAQRTQAVDVWITPDTSFCEFADFSRGRELFEVGAAAARAVVPEILQLVAELERSA
ncbi:MAG: patatin-like phospholipase family protein [Pirellulales bacterium]|nr:patatin-like phospholipase family protein [Pirellulales bacterium]